MTKYNQDIEKKMLLHYSNLREKERRHYASLEAEKLGFGGKTYIGNLFGISQKTLRKGSSELTNPLIHQQIGNDRQRRKGGGRKKNQR